MSGDLRESRNAIPFTSFSSISGDARALISLSLLPSALDLRPRIPDSRRRRSTNFNLTVERQLDKATILSVGYVGNRGRHEEGAIDLNLAGQYPGINPIAAAFTGGTALVELAS